MTRHTIVTFCITTGLVLTAIWYVYANYYQQIYDWFGAQVEYPIFVGDAFFSVTVADEPEERRQGLSNTEPLPDQGGLLFIFDESDRYGMWMKDMLFAIDILWIDESFTIVHIAENVEPDTYPTVFRSADPARFVLEIPAFSVESFKIEVGDTVRIPGDIIPKDLQSI